MQNTRNGFHFPENIISVFRKKNYTQIDVALNFPVRRACSYIPAGIIISPIHILTKECALNDPDVYFSRHDHTP